MIDPAFGTLPIADTPPVFKFGRNFDRHARMRIDPPHLLVLVRTGANVDSIGFEADEPRDWKGACRGGGDPCRPHAQMAGRGRSRWRPRPPTGQDGAAMPPCRLPARRHPAWSGSFVLLGPSGRKKHGFRWHAVSATTVKEG